MRLYARRGGGAVALQKIGLHYFYLNRPIQIADNQVGATGSGHLYEQGFQSTVKHEKNIIDMIKSREHALQTKMLQYFLTVSLYHYKRLCFYLDFTRNTQNIDMEQELGVFPTFFTNTNVKIRDNFRDFGAHRPVRENDVEKFKTGQKHFSNI